jgi:hypothetical protein
MKQSSLERKQIVKHQLDIEKQCKEQASKAKKKQTESENN